MAYDFKNIATVDVAETVSDTANVLIEDDGVIKRAAKSQFGGAGGGSTTVLKVTISGDVVGSDEGVVEPEEAYSYEDIKEKILKGERLVVIAYDVRSIDGNEPSNDYITLMPGVVNNFGIVFAMVTRNHGYHNLNFKNDGSWSV